MSHRPQSSVTSRIEKPESLRLPSRAAPPHATCHLDLAEASEHVGHGGVELVFAALWLPVDGDDARQRREQHGLQASHGHGCAVGVIHARKGLEALLELRDLPCAQPGFEVAEMISRLLVVVPAPYQADRDDHLPMPRTLVNLDQGGRLVQHALTQQHRNRLRAASLPLAISVGLHTAEATPARTAARRKDKPTTSCNQVGLICGNQPAQPHRHFGLYRRQGPDVDFQSGMWGCGLRGARCRTIQEGIENHLQHAGVRHRLVAVAH
eukprot:scaffold55987_cov72-Phaeocystis_antarctica.AAC.3